MGWNDHLDSELSDLPEEAFENNFDVDGPFEPNDRWLKASERDHQIIALRHWFLARYCDPAVETPYISREGGYQYVNGGPYSPEEELFDRFSGIVPDEIIDEVVHEMEMEVGHEWAPINRYEPDEYDSRFELTVAQHKEPFSRLQERVANAKAVLVLTGEPKAVELAEQLVYSALITALEAFLWETAHYWVENDNAVVRNIVTKLPAFAERTLKLNEIFDRHQRLQEEVKGYLQNLVWHRWDKVATLYKLGLEITDLPSFQPFQKAIQKRHDIVHRSGHSIDGKPIKIEVGEIGELCELITNFAAEIDSQLQSHISIKSIGTCKQVAPK